MHSILRLLLRLKYLIILVNQNTKIIEILDYFSV